MARFKVTYIVDAANEDEALKPLENIGIKSVRWFSVMPVEENYKPTPKIKGWGGQLWYLLTGK